MLNKARSRTRKISHQTMLYIFAGLLGITTFGALLWLSTFLVSNVNQALGPSVQAVEHVSFDIEGFEKLHLLGK